MTEFKKGAYVKHNTNNYKGIIVGTTKISDLFEDKTNTEEYRVAISGTTDIKIASPSNLIPLNESEIKECTIEAHKKFLNDKGIKYEGIKIKNATTRYRETHCYSCKTPINNVIDIACNNCGWILCSCGACGCGYNKSQNKYLK